MVSIILPLYHEVAGKDMTSKLTKDLARFITASKLGQGYVFTRVCDSVHMGGSVSQHNLQVIFQHALQVSREVVSQHALQVSRGDLQAHTQGGRLIGLARGSLQAHTWGFSKPIPGGGVSRPTPGSPQAHTHGVCIPACTEANPLEQSMLGDTANKRAVRILLECILV